MSSASAAADGGLGVPKRRSGSSAAGHGPAPIHLRIGSARMQSEDAHANADGNSATIDTLVPSGGGSGGVVTTGPQAASRGSASLPSIRRVSSGASIAAAHHNAGKIGSFSSIGGGGGGHGSKVGSFSSSASGWDDSPLVRPRFHSDPAEEVSLAAASSSPLLTAAAAAAAATVAAAAMAAAHSHTRTAPAAHNASATNTAGTYGHGAAAVPATVSSKPSSDATLHSPLQPASPASSSDSSTSPRSDDGDAGFSSLVNALPHPHHHGHHHGNAARPAHFHAGLSTSMHNPQVMMNKYHADKHKSGGSGGGASSASSSGGAVTALDEDDNNNPNLDDIRLVDASGPVSSSSPRPSVEEEPLSPRSQTALSSLPVPVLPPWAHFTPESWSWKGIDYVDEAQVGLLTQFFSAIETHSHVFVERSNNPPPQPAPQPAAALQPLSGRRFSQELPPLPPLPSLRTSSSTGANGLAAAAAAGQASSAAIAVPSLQRSHTAGMPALNFASLHSDGSAASASSSASASPRPRPVYPPNFQAHRLHSLQLHARKDLLRKSKIVDSDMHGQGIGGKNPSETLLANLIASCGSVPASAASPPPSGALSARGHSSAQHAAAAAAAAALQSPSAAAAAALPPPSLNVLPHLHTLDFRMGVHGAILAEALKRNQSLTHINLSNNVISEKGCTALCRNLQSHPQLRDLRLSYNILYPPCAAPLRDLLLYNRSITALDLAINKLESVGVATVLEALGASKPNQRAIKEAVERATAPVAQQQQNSAPLSARGGRSANEGAGAGGAASPPSGSANSSSSGAASAYAPSPSSSSSPPPGLSLMPAFSINQSLTFLDISNNRIGSDIESVASALTCANSQLRDLRLCLNDIGDTGANYLALALRHPVCALRSLDIADNVIGPLGCKALMSALEQNKSLTKLDMSWNSLGQSGLGEGPRAVGRMLGLNTTLRELSVQSNGISEGGMRSICAGWTEGLQSSGSGSALQVLDLGINPIGNDGVRELATILAHPACPLRSLSLNRCQLSEDGCYALVQALQLNNGNLRRLSMLGNAGIKADAAGQLIDAYSKSAALVELDLEDSPHISRDEALGAAYRRARAGQFAQLVSSGSGLPVDLSLLVAEYHLERRKAIVPVASSSSSSSGGRDDMDG